MGQSSAPINEGVNLLDDYRPETLARLQAEYPDLGPHLRPGGLAGPAAPLVLARARVCLEILQETEGLCDRGIANAQSRLRTQSRLNVLGSAIATAGSASVVTSLSASYEAVAMISGVVSLAGSIGTLFAQHLGKVRDEGTSLYEAYRKIVELKAQARLLALDLRARLEYDPQTEDEKTIADLVGQGNAFFLEVSRWLALLEVPRAK